MCQKKTNTRHFIDNMTMQWLKMQLEVIYICKADMQTMLSPNQYLS